MLASRRFPPPSRYVAMLFSQEPPRKSAAPPPVVHRTAQYESSCVRLGLPFRSASQTLAVYPVSLSAVSRYVSCDSPPSSSTSRIDGRSTNVANDSLDIIEVSPLLVAVSVVRAMPCTVPTVSVMWTSKVSFADGSSTQSHGP